MLRHSILPCSTITRCTIASPRPEPLRSPPGRAVVKKRSPRRGSACRARRACVLHATVAPSSSTRTVLPAGAKSIALVQQAANRQVMSSASHGPLWPWPVGSKPRCVVRRGPACGRWRRRAVDAAPRGASLGVLAAPACSAPAAGQSAAAGVRFAAPPASQIPRGLRRQVIP